MQAEPADVILHSGRLWDGRHVEGGEAIAVASGRVLASGSNAQVDRHRAVHTRSIDVQGRRIMPGLIDSHLHMVRAGLRWGDDVHWHDLGSLVEGLEAISRGAEDREPGRWMAVMGGWSPHQFDEKRPPTREELDEAAPNHPVFVQRNYIEAFLNSRALEEMGWPTESGGRVTGLPPLAELRAKLADIDFDEQVEGTRSLLRHLNRLGLTGCIDAGGFGMTPAAYRSISELQQKGELGFRARLLVGAGHPGSERAQLDDWLGLVSPGSGDEHLRYLGAGEVLLFGAHDMEGLDRRDISAEGGALTELIVRLARSGWPVHIHAILDTSVTTILDAWEAVGSGSDLAALRFTVTHADQIGEANLRRIRDMGLGVTVQDGMAFRGGDAIPTWGEERVRRAPPLRDLLEMGIPLGAGTDGTVVSSPNPWVCIGWMVSGEAWEGAPQRTVGQLLTRDEALRLYTSGSAWFSFEEDTRGTLRTGSEADLVVLSDDPLTVATDRLPKIESVLTIVDGNVVHSVLDR